MLERAQFAYNAGFRNTNSIEALTIILAISQAECGMGSATGCEYGCDAGGDAANSTCGIWQIYQPAHPGTRACASDPACCATLAWAISNHGTSFGAWSTYNSGVFRNYLAEARVAAIAVQSPTPTPTPTPTPPPTPVPVSPPATATSALPWLLIAAGGLGLAYWEVRKQGVQVSVSGGGFGESKVAIRRTTPTASRRPRQSAFD